MNTFIWILQWIIAAFFLIPGLRKAFFSKEKLMELKLLEAGKPVTFHRFLGTVELLGVIGIIVPLLTGIQPVLTPLAASGFAVIMFAAFFLHFSRKEYKVLPVNALAFVLSALVAWYRFKYI